MRGLPFCFFICSFPYLFTCLFKFFIYLFLPFFIFYFFTLSLCHSFYFLSIFLEPEPKLFHVTWVNKLHWHFIFYMVCNGKSKQHRQIRCSGVFWLFRCSGVLWGVPECFRVFLCSCVPVFLLLVHVILLTIFDNAWQNPVKWLLRARQIRSTSDANMEHAGEENSTWVFRFRVAQVCSLSFQIKFGNALQNPVSWRLRDIEMKSTWTAIFTFRREQNISFSLCKQGTDARRLHYFYGLLFKNKG